MPPMLTATGRNPSFRRNLAASDLFSGVTAATDGDNIDLVTFSVTNVTDPANERLIVDGRQISLTNGNVQTTGSGYAVTVSLTGTTATVTLTPPAGGITAAQLQGLIDTLAYQNVSTTTQTLARTVTVTGISDTGGDDVALSLTSTVAPAPGVNELVSANNSGAQGNGDSFLTGGERFTLDASLSRNGRYVAFYSDATNLVPDDTNGVRDVFVRDRTSDTTVRVSIAYDGAEANGASSRATLSADGTRVAFESVAFNLVVGDISENTPGLMTDIYVRDLTTQTNRKVSVTPTGGDGNGESTDAEISQQGNHVVFTGSALTNNLVDGTSPGGADTNGQSDIFVRNLSTDTTIRASLANDGAQANGGSIEGTISANGQFVAFSSLASNLVVGDTNATAAFGSGQDIFRRDTVNSVTIRVSVADDEAQATDGSVSFAASMSDDANIIAFVSSATNLQVGADQNGATYDIFVRNVNAGTTIRIQNPGTNAFALNLPSYAPSVSANGRYIAYQWGGGTWVYDMVTQTNTSATRTAGNTDTTGVGGAISGDGTTVVFESAGTQYVDGHTGTFTDVFATTLNFGNVAPTITSSDVNTFGTEDTSFFVRRTDGQQIFTVADPDAGQTLTVQVWVERGTLSIDGSNGGAAVSGAGAALNLTGTPAQINTALNNLKYTPSLNYSGPVEITITATDDAAIPASFTQNGNPFLRQYLTVAPVNDNPALTGLTDTINTRSAGQIIDSDVTLTDPEGNWNGGRIRVTGLLPEDRVSIASSGPISVSTNFVRYNGVTVGTFSGGVGTEFRVIFNGAATTAIVEAVIEHLQYADAVVNMPTPSRTLSIHVIDGSGGTIDFPGQDLPFSTFQERQGAANPFTGIDSGGGDVRAAPALADLDDDGDVDLVVGQRDGTLSIYNNDGAGHFTLAGSFDAGIREARPAIVDLDGDGFLELVVGLRSGEISYYEQNGAGQFVPAAINPFAGVNAGAPAKPALADVDGDGDLDLLVGSSDGVNGIILYYRNDGGTFNGGAPNPFAAISIPGEHAAPAFVDLDGDGDLDLTVGYSASSGGGVYSYVNNNGTFTRLNPDPLAQVRGGMDSAVMPAYGDVDGDGDLDLVLGNTDGSLQYFQDVTTTRGQQVVVNVAPPAPPTVDLNGAAAGTDATVNYTENANAVAIAPAATVADIDSTDFDGGTLTVTITANGAAEDRLSIIDTDYVRVSNGIIQTGSIQTPPGGQPGFVPDATVGFYTGGTGTFPLAVTFNASATAERVQRVIEAVGYRNVSDTPSTGARTASFVLTDGDGGTSAATTATINVAAVDDAPTATIAPNAYQATEQIPLSLKGGITVADVDAGGGTVTATLSVGYGIIDVGVGGSGATVVSGNGTGSVTVSGTIAQLNALLGSDATSTLTYTPNTDAPPASTTLTVTVDDGGNTGSGGPQTGSASTTIAITAVGDDPTAVADTGATTETAATTGNLLTNDTDPDGGTKAVIQVNGVAGNVGTPITLASGALLTVNADGTYSYNPNGAFNYLVSPATAAATGAQNGSATDSFTYGLNGGSSTTVTITITGVDGPGDQLRGGAGNDTITGTPQPDYFNVSQGGDDTVSGGGSDDAFYFGAAFTVADSVDGGAGALDQIGLQGDYTGGNALTLGANSLVGIENLVLLSGANAAFGDTANNRYDYVVTAADAALTAGRVVAVSANTLLAGEDVTFDARLETNGSYIYYGGAGADHVTGTQTSDGVFFGVGLFGPGDSVDGQGGDLDQVAIQGDFVGTGRLILTDGQLVSVENLVLISAHDLRFTTAGGPDFTYDITLSDGIVTNSRPFALSANSLQAGESLTLDATAETESAITVYSGAGNDVLNLGQSGDLVFGGAGNDTINGNGGADRIYGGAGADQLSGGAGNDTFFYLNVADSTATSLDHILDFAQGDHIDVSALGGFTLVTGAFTGAGQLRVRSAGGNDYLVETNGNGNADLSLLVTSDHPLTASDFVGVTAGNQAMFHDLVVPTYVAADAAMDLADLGSRFRMDHADLALTVSSLQVEATADLHDWHAALTPLPDIPPAVGMM